MFIIDVDTRVRMIALKLAVRHGFSPLPHVIVSHAREFEQYIRGGSGRDEEETSASHAGGDSADASDRYLMRPPSPIKNDPAGPNLASSPAGSPKEPRVVS